MKTSIFVLSAFVSAVALGQSVPVPNAPARLCIDDQCAASAPTSTSLSLRYVDGFESGSLLTSLWTYSDAGAAAHSFPTGIAREGSRAHRCDLTWNSNKSFRCEVSGLMKDYRGLNNPQFFKDTWWGFSIRPGDDPIQKGCIYAQWHGYAGFGAGDEADTIKLPILALAIDTTDRNANFWKLHGQSGHSQPTLDSDRKTAFGDYRLAPVDPNAWTDFVFHIRWDYRQNGNGVVRVWVNGQLKLDKQGIAIGHNDNQLPYFKMGAYCSGYKSGTPTGAQRTVYHDALRMTLGGGSYDAVKPGQG